jgi:poly(A) polymerase
VRIRYSATKDGKPVKKAVVYTRDEHGISLADVDPDAVRITGRLKAAGFETYIVGGAVRDLILGKQPKDFDIVSQASPGQIKKIFRNARIIGNRFRLVHVYTGKKLFEVSTFRSLKDGHTSNTFGSIEEDVLRRDFTLNALFYDPHNQVVVDFVGGMKDIKARKIRPVIPLHTIFKDDPVRMIRAVKYGAATEFVLPLSLRWRIRRESAMLTQVSPSRLTEEISKIIHSSSAARIVERLEAAGLFRYLQPNASKLFRENPAFRGQYLEDLAAGAAREDQPGAVMSALVRAFLEGSTDWNTVDPQETYMTAFVAARRFVLPMNPPRVELDHAVRMVFAEHGFKVKRARFPLRLRDLSGESPIARAEPEQRQRLSPEGAEAAPKRRRRRRHKAPGPEGGAVPPAPAPGGAQGTARKAADMATRSAAPGESQGTAAGNSGPEGG